MPTSIQAIIFDFGGVLSTHDNLETIGRLLAKKHHVDARTVDEITLRGWLKARVNPHHDRVFWTELAQALSISPKSLQREYLRFPKRVPEVIRFARQLKRRGYRLAMLSNQIMSWHQLLMKRWRLTDLFETVVTSYASGIAKPDTAIYKMTLKHLKLPAEACIYIDDREANLRPAEALGMRTILATTPAKLVRDLQKHLQP